MATIDGKQVVNIISHAGVESMLTTGYSQLTKKLLKMATPKVDFNMGDIGMLTVDIMLAMATHDMFIKQGIIPADIMK